MHHAQREHTVIDNQGVEHTFTSIVGFAREHGINASSLSRIVNGHQNNKLGFKLKGEPNNIKANGKSFNGKPFKKSKMNKESELFNLVLNC